VQVPATFPPPAGSRFVMKIDANAAAAFAVVGVNPTKLFDVMRASVSVVVAAFAVKVTVV